MKIVVTRELIEDDILWSEAIEHIWKICIAEMQADIAAEWEKQNDEIINGTGEDEPVGILKL